MSELMTMDIAEDEIFLSPWLKAGSISMVYAKRGVGKTWFCLSLMLAISRGMQFGNWDVEKPVNCLYIDGEMSISDIKTRLSRLSETLPAELANITVLSNDLMRQKSKVWLDLSDTEWRREVSLFLARSDYKVVFIDNVASLTPGLIENDKENWDPVNQWLLWLRSLGLAVIIVHHEGKKDGPRGTSGREDALDYSIKLSTPTGHSAKDGAKFRIDFTKARGICGQAAESFTLSIETVNGQLAWATSVSEDTKRHAVISLLGSGIPQKYIPQQAGCSKGLVSRYKKQAIEAGFLDANGLFTPAGRKKYAADDILGIG